MAKAKKFAWNRDSDSAEPTRRDRNASLPKQPNPGTGPNDRYRYVVRDKVSGLYLKTRRSSASAGNGYYSMQVVPNYAEATKYKTTEEAAQALKTYNSKLNKSTFKIMVWDKFNVIMKLGPEFTVINCEKLTDEDKYPGIESSIHPKEGNTNDIDQI
jgi:hypothetical protein